MNTARKNTTPKTIYLRKFQINMYTKKLSVDYKVSSPDHASYTRIPTWFILQQLNLQRNKWITATVISFFISNNYSIECLQDCHLFNSTTSGYLRHLKIFESYAIINIDKIIIDCHILEYETSLLKI